MKNDDQWFEPGDKVMRVRANTPLGIPFTLTPEEGVELAPFGKVFCVVYCENDKGVNWAKLAGHSTNKFLCSNFRKVEEIQLCVRAAEAMKKPKKQEEMA